MDDQRFDRLTRMLVTGASRRKGIRILGGAAAALLALARETMSGVAAQQLWLSAGDPCYDSSQCRAADAPLTCADNGFDYDGPLNCCTFEGSRCGFDEGCCGSATCFNGFCASAPVFLGPGDPCQNSSQCLGADAALYCDYVASTDDYRCCTTDGGRCGWDGGCCGWLTCSGGFCTSMPAPQPVPMPACTGEWCDCYQGPYDDNPCDPGLVCCLSTETTGVCVPLYTCTGTGAPGDDCPRYCLPGPTQCPSCVSGYCTAAGVCG